MEKPFRGVLSPPIKPLTAVCLIYEQVGVFWFRSTDPSSGKTGIITIGTAPRQPLIENIFENPRL